MAGHVTVRAHWDSEAPFVCPPEEPVADYLCAVAPHIASAMATPGGRILDLGCGTGRLLAPLAVMAPRAHFVGVDVSPNMLAEAARMLYAAEVSNYSLVLGTGVHLPDIGAVDAAYSVCVFQHCDPLTVCRYLNELLTWHLRDGGVLRFQFVGCDDNTPRQDGPFDWKYPGSWLDREIFGMGAMCLDYSPGLHSEWGWEWRTYRRGG